jgi:hypothetical protein
VCTRNVPTRSTKATVSSAKAGIIQSFSAGNQLGELFMLDLIDSLTGKVDNKTNTAGPSSRRRTGRFSFLWDHFQLAPISIQSPTKA